MAMAICGSPRDKRILRKGIEDVLHLSLMIAGRGSRELDMIRV
jgi:hypothetical protein